MITVLTAILTIILIARAVEEGTKIPAPLSLLVLSYVSGIVFGDLFAVSAHEFGEILYLMLPIILLPDILNLSLKELKANALSVLYLAFFAVLFSIALGVALGSWVLSEYNLDIGMLIALFTMLMATDAITVSSIFSKFSLPAKLKVYAESESLFNDVTTLILFYFAALPLLSGEAVTFASLNLVLLKVIALSALLGVVLGYLGYLAVKFLTDTLEQFIIIYLVVVIAFLSAEHLNVSGILAIVASALSFKLFLKKELAKPTVTMHKSVADQSYSSRFESLLQYLHNVPAITKKEFRHFKKEAYFVGIFANAVVFVVMARIFDFTLLATYYKEILGVFALTTAIRFVPVSALIAKQKLPFRWSGVLTFSGIKGGLAIIMVHSLPQSFVYKDLFTAIVIGHVILTTFGYTAVLLLFMRFFKTAFEQDQIAYGDFSQPQEEQKQEVEHQIKNIMEKDPQTGVFNEIITRRILERELHRSKRYKLELSLLLIAVGNDPVQNARQRTAQTKQVLGICDDALRQQDVIGKVGESRYLIIAVNTPLSGASVVAQRLQKDFKVLLSGSSQQIDISITDAETTDDSTDLFEKLDDALVHAAKKSGGCNIEIEI